MFLELEIDPRNPLIQELTNMNNKKDEDVINNVIAHKNHLKGDYNNINNNINNRKRPNDCIGYLKKIDKRNRIE